MRSDTPKGRRARWWGEALVIVALCWIYDDLANLAKLRKNLALHHADQVLHLERSLHLDPEHLMNHWLAQHATLGLLAGDYYNNLHFVVTFGVVGWLWWRRPGAYRPLRTGLIIANVIGFLVYWLYPMAPPWFLPHFVNIAVVTHSFGSTHSGLPVQPDEFAAMPSLHLAWAVWSAWAVWCVLPRTRWRWLVMGYPLLTAVVVLATANHFLIDTAAGIATAAVSLALARAAYRYRVGGRLVRLVARRDLLGGVPAPVPVPVAAFDTSRHEEPLARAMQEHQ